MTSMDKAGIGIAIAVVAIALGFTAFSEPSSSEITPIVELKKPNNWVKLQKKLPHQSYLQGLFQSQKELTFLDVKKQIFAMIHHL